MLGSKAPPQRRLRLSRLPFSFGLTDMPPWLRLCAVFLAAGLLLAGTALILEYRQAADPNAGKYPWIGSPEPLYASPSDDMVLIEAGEYVVGDDAPDAAADAPVTRVWLDAFLIDRHEVTNRQFQRFVQAAGYATAAEQSGSGWLYIGGERDWQKVRGASWNHPLGPDSSIEGALDYPVVLVSWHDADAYAEWAGKRLPTETEWEVAARGMTCLSSPEIADPGQDGSSNVWQGYWPRRNRMLDRFFYAAPVGSFRPNSLGLFDMIGNVWEWTSDWYAPDTYRSDVLVHNPTGPITGQRRVARGGSWFCSPNYCSAYRPGFRGKSPPGHGFNNMGFRCARDVENVEDHSSRVGVQSDSSTLVLCST